MMHPLARSSTVCHAVMIVTYTMTRDDMMRLYVVKVRKLEKAETRVLVSMTWTLETTVGDRR